MERRRHLDPLTTLRFVAALLIFVHHIWGRFGLPGVHKVDLFFGVGVPFFFALSGFILAYNYPASNDPRTMARMIGYRVARIWPLHIACTALFLAVAFNPASPFQQAEALVPNLLLVHSWTGVAPLAFSFNGVSWSLSVEFAFYLAFPFLIMCSSAVLVSIAVVGTSTLLIWSGAAWQSAFKYTDIVVSGQMLSTTHPLASVAVFISGILAARLFAKAEGWQTGKWKATGFEIAAVGLFVGFMLLNRPVAVWIVTKFDIGPAVGRWIIPNLGIVAFVPAIFIFARGEGLISKALSWRWAVWLGEISFAFYLCHQFLLTWVNRTFAFGVEGVFVTLAAAIGLAAALHYTVERPAQRAIRRVVDRLTSRPVAAE